MNETANGPMSASATRPVGRSAGPTVNPALPEPEIAALTAAALAARERAYAPYSHFRVGAALLAADGTIYAGCNVENASYGLTICAERNAAAHAVACGARAFVAIVVATENGVTPCGACRQVLAEFNPQMTVILVDEAGRRRIYSLAELLPAAFVADQLPASAQASG
ncbi:MAG: cytidine deaminase [Anaerolineae bacterium]|nr:cytidine deaminase [Anaerolineae bacterium]